MQREIKRKTISYGIVAVLLACVLTATVYNLGVQPFTPENGLPSDNNNPDSNDPGDSNLPANNNSSDQNTPNPNLPGDQSTVPVVFSNLKTFENYSELETFLSTNIEKASQSSYFPEAAWDTGTFGGYGGEPSAQNEYSTTNVQVAGVDEADIVKSDGEYLYVVSDPYVYIVKAYPTAQAEVVSKILINETYSAQIYVNENRLVILSNYDPYTVYWGGVAFSPYVYREEMSITVYDLTDKANPVLSRTVNINGSMTGSRMIGDYVYTVVNQAVYQTTENGTEVWLPTIAGDDIIEIQPNEVHYVDAPDTSYRVTTVFAVNIMNDTQEPTYEPFLTGYSTEMYVSLDNMYLVVPNTNWYFAVDLEEGGEPQEETLVYRIALDQDSVTVMNEGAVPGHILNQFSMDEYNDYFRIATTTNNWWTATAPTNNLYVMNMTLDIVGSLEGLAEGETIYSTRFMGDRGYVVTFRNIDPLFVIDLSNPTAPTVLGALKVTGYSAYLHPYDETHIIGIGKETEAADREDFAWYQGVKISLFDVSNVSNPVEVAKYTIGNRGTTSPILDDHKALLFDKSRNLLVIPVLVAEIDESEYPDGVPDWAYGDYVSQGAYVFDISPDGITLRKVITHLEDGVDLTSSYSQYSDYFVERALYIENVLYTVSNKLVKLNDLGSLDLDLIKEIELS